MAREPWYAAPERCAANGARIHAPNLNYCRCQDCGRSSEARLAAAIHTEGTVDA